ncbi:MAG: HNH endonuclease [Myxococcales bacterium]|nr:HNH endonuclease [Myxococcales bacterium]MCB9568300.1 HNH endonuclease [Myxococcales bacterium]MCB9705023.1 HNH endonuclease [Myxococcales bacterium]
MSAQKKQVRAAFRDAVFARARYRCEGPGCAFTSTRERAEAELDAHHITDRNEMPKGGYVVENGIALCPACHAKAEQFHATGEALPGFHPDELYRIIASSREKAERASRRLR